MLAVAPRRGRWRLPQADRRSGSRRHRFFSAHLLATLAAAPPRRAPYGRRGTARFCVIFCSYLSHEVRAALPPRCGGAAALASAPFYSKCKNKSLQSRSGFKSQSGYLNAALASIPIATPAMGGERSAAPARGIDYSIRLSRFGGGLNKKRNASRRDQFLLASFMATKSP